MTLRFLFTFLAVFTFFAEYELSAAAPAEDYKEFAQLSDKLQKEADILREQGQSLEAINLYNEAIVHYQETKDYSHLLSALTGRLLCWKHLFYKTKDSLYAIFVQKEAETMEEIALIYGFQDRLFLIHFLNATAATQFEQYSRAETEFAKALALYPTDTAEKGDWMAHLGDAMYRNGKKEEGLALILQGIQQIKDHASEIDSFRFNVWISGAYLRLAKVLKSDNAAKSEFYLNQAKTIIDSDNRLVIRKQQLDDYVR